MAIPRAGQHLLLAWISFCLIGVHGQEFSSESGSYVTLLDAINQQSPSATSSVFDSNCKCDMSLGSAEGSIRLYYMLNSHNPLRSVVRIASCPSTQKQLWTCQVELVHTVEVLVALLLALEVECLSVK